MHSSALGHFSLALLRISLAGLMFWWGLAKGMNTGVGQGVSNKYYGGVFSADILLIGFGWLQVAVAILLALGLYRLPLLIFQLFVNLFVAVVVWQSILDPFWYWMPGARPETVNQLFYPSFIVVAGSLVMLTMQDRDCWALDRLVRRA